MSSTRAVTLLCYGALVVFAFSGNLQPIFLTAWGREFLGGADRFEPLGRIAAVGGTAWVLSLGLTGPLADRFGPKPFFVGGCFLVGLGLAVTALAPSYAWLLVGTAVAALGGGTLDMVTSPVVAALYPERKAAALSALHAFWAFGSAFTLAVGTVALLTAFSWRAVFGLLAIFPFGLALLSARTRFPELPRAEVRTRFGRLAASPFFWLATVGIVAAGASEMGVGLWLPTHLETTLQQPGWMGSVGLLGLMLAMGLGRWAAGTWLSHWPVRRLMAAASVGCLLSILATAYAPHSGVALGAAVGVGLFSAVFWPSLLALASDRFPDAGATLFGWLGAAGNVAGIFGPWGLGVLADAAGMRAALAWSGLAPVAVLAVVAAFAIGARRSAGSQRA